MVIVVFLIVQRSTPAPATGRVDSRVSRLESETTLIRSRLSRLETQLSRVGRASGVEIPDLNISDNVAPSPPPAPMLERLGTLLIEQRERIDRLEARIVELERSRPAS
ncbi:hypothetical protein IQ268_24695 [Oculatella sp. LEGE 06141]|nr:hypothetical protein [Oculatella sp. LEGE 06141]MBE9181769.1 hypothetical protein [Oculatella sp. LEGE 06141]